MRSEEHTEALVTERINPGGPGAGEVGRHLEAIELLPPFELNRSGGGDTGDPVEPVAAGDLDEPGRNRRGGLNAASPDRIVVAIEVLPDGLGQPRGVGVDADWRAGTQ